MGSIASEGTHEFPPYFRVYNDGRVERFKVVADYSPPSVDPETGVESKDVVISEETGVKVRIFLPKINCLDQTKLPLLVHYHGGAFCVGSSLDVVTTRLLNLQTSVANVVTVSVDYRLAPEHPLPIAYDDSWSALQWIATHLNGKGPELWLNEHVDFGRVFLTGDSVGANIAQHLAVRLGVTGLDGFRVRGAVMVHPYFAVSDPDKMIQYLYE